MGLICVRLPLTCAQQEGGGSQPSPMQEGGGGGGGGSRGPGSAARGRRRGKRRPAQRRREPDAEERARARSESRGYVGLDSELVRVHVVLCGMLWWLLWISLDLGTSRACVRVAHVPGRVSSVMSKCV